MCSPFICNALGPFELGLDISELCFKGTILQRNYIKLPSAFKSFIFSIFEWLLKTGFTV